MSYIEHPNQDPVIVADANAEAAIGADIGTLFGLAETREAQGDIQGAVALYRNWVARNPAHPLLHAAYFNYGVALNKSGDRYGAMNALRAALSLKPDFMPSHINLGRLLEDDGQFDAAVTQWLTLVSQTGLIDGSSVKHKLVALQQIGRVLETFQQDEPAEDALRQSLDINENQPEVAQHWIALRQRQCKWPAVTPSEHVSLKALFTHISPLSLAVHSDDPMFQLARAFKYSKELTGPPRRPLCHATAAKERASLRQKLRIGYVSSDLREHAVGFAMADVLETHDRQAFEITAYYCGIDRPDGTKDRSQKSVDHWVDITRLSDEQAAQRIREDGIDILIDLNGYTKDARSRIFSYRPAPVTVNWFGFPGTMGSAHHHYIIADPIVVPEEDEIFYSEKVLRLACYQPNDRKRVVASEPLSREGAGLPADGFVYCCLNGCQKLTPEVFASWLTILRQVPDSVLWLLSGGADTDKRLRQLAANGGIAAERLIFAEKMPNPQHLARYQLADLFLDNSPYGAHTTASDAMWMGVPVLTYPGKTFASRVCASLVHAAGLGDLVCDSENSYVARAIALGKDRAQIETLKARLLSSRSSSRLFDTPALVRDLEELFRHMWTEAVEGRLPKPDHTNLNDYFDIGLDIAVNGKVPAARDELCKLYRDRLEAWNSAIRLPRDSRLWP
ncbi:O-linked N-acetylglucosamine transferase, SPINDLY family protein [Hyphomicrobium sp. DMF-1]|jgi:predicted O-linked N-acetylglucosamine transferase (SPINDLY family)|uniref:O-linked N-acetylglucosamine transferase, SPINDLY family protein n=1 Tax=Hyphomicrobium sp. DMF-1 TaxID=3019544 RepID=UPI0022EBD4F7|nr:glycosyl transferase [Hyphomicrobium sp. DMF-1]WBT37034.1 glycosyl transferase [Hyphomicrobium sp. DMF-1]